MLKLLQIKYIKIIFKTKILLIIEYFAIIIDNCIEKFY